MITYVEAVSDIIIFHFHHRFIQIVSIHRFIVRFSGKTIPVKFVYIPLGIVVAIKVNDIYYWSTDLWSLEKEFVSSFRELFCIERIWGMNIRILHSARPNAHLIGTVSPRYTHVRPSVSLILRALFTNLLDSNSLSGVYFHILFSWTQFAAQVNMLAWLCTICIAPILTIPIIISGLMRRKSGESFNFWWKLIFEWVSFNLQTTFPYSFYYPRWWWRYSWSIIWSLASEVCYYCFEFN